MGLRSAPPARGAPLKSILPPRFSTTVSQLPDVLSEEHESLNVFSAGEDSAQQIEEIVFLDPSFLALKKKKKKKKKKKDQRSNSTPG